MKDWEPGVRAFFKRNPNCFKTGSAHFDEIEIHGIADDSARPNALKAGRIDDMNRAMLKTVHLQQRLSV